MVQTNTVSDSPWASFFGGTIYFPLFHSSPNKVGISLMCPSFFNSDLEPGSERMWRKVQHHFFNLGLRWYYIVIIHESSHLVYCSLVHGIKTLNFLFCLVPSRGQLYQSNQKWFAGRAQCECVQIFCITRIPYSLWIRKRGGPRLRSRRQHYYWPKKKMHTPTSREKWFKQYTVICLHDC